MMSQTLKVDFLQKVHESRNSHLKLPNLLGTQVVPVSSCLGSDNAFKLSGVGPGTEVISTPLTCSW